MDIFKFSCCIMLLLDVGSITLSTKPDVCSSYRNLSDPWRNRGFYSDSFQGWPKSDSGLAAGWYRFTGVGGDVLTKSCFYKSTISAGGTNSFRSLCGQQTFGPQLGEGVRAMELVCKPPSTTCGKTINVTACPGGFYLYQLFPTDGVFVTDHSVCKTSSCGEHGQCDPSLGCSCRKGFEIPSKFLPTGDSYGCQAMASACPQPCGPNGQCLYIQDTFKCSCKPGFRESPSAMFTCEDVNECDKSLCGRDRGVSCTNRPGGFHCECPSGHIPTPGLDWKTNVTVCKELNQYIPIEQGKSKALDQLLEMIQNMTSDALPVQTVSLLLDRLVNDDPGRSISHRNSVLKSMEKLVSQLVSGPFALKNTSFSTNTTEVEILSTEPRASLMAPSVLSVSNISMDIDLLGIAENNNGSASVVLMASSLMAAVFDGGPAKTVMSTVVTVTLLGVTNATLPNPVQFTFRHIIASHLRGQLSCMYWNARAWIEDGCRISETNSMHTVCSCEHLSTFALIMRTTDTFLSDPILEVLNTIFVLIGLVFLTLAVMTFALCRWNPRVSNVARLNLCVCLLLAQPLFLLTQSFIHLIRTHQALCKVLSGVLHFLFLCCFVWMSIEAVLLFLSVRKLKQVKPNERVGPHRLLLYLIGYGVPLIIVAVSASVMSDGYGSQQCWLSTESGFIWSFLGPVTFILTVNIVLFVTILLILFLTLREAPSTVSKVSYTRVLAVKLLFQFFLLGCPWVLGFFVHAGQAVEALFVLLNSQQGTFIFLVHCVLNKEVRRQYWSWFQGFLSSGGSSLPTSATTVSPTSKERPATGMRDSAI